MSIVTLVCHLVPDTTAGSPAPVGGHSYEWFPLEAHYCLVSDKLLLRLICKEHTCLIISNRAITFYFNIKIYKATVKLILFYFYFI